ncbi:MAG: hypothetical protein JSW49_04875 [candidate division WOR-3 bacterium]|nr:MAG: hypothetical protein JSW49_04875 [candidate division WOR-3 bacterium]
MFGMFITNLLWLSSVQAAEPIEISIGPQYSSYSLYMDDSGSLTEWNLGGEIGVYNIIPHIGLKLRGTKVKFYPLIMEESYEYMPITLCTSFDMIPFLRLPWLRLSAETGLGLYNWKGYWLDDIIVLPSGELMEEWDIGFVVGFTVQLRPTKYLGVEYAMRYNYIASTDVEKYGFYDKDDKIWENGFGVKFILPL